MGWVSLVVTLILVAPSNASQPTPPDPPPAVPSDTIVLDGRWVRPPRVQYPTRAAAQGVASGWADIRCVVLVTGRLSDCTVLSEGPVGYGFGPEATRAMSLASLHPSLAGQIVQQRVNFRLGD